MLENVKKVLDQCYKLHASICYVEANNQEGRFKDILVHLKKDAESLEMHESLLESYMHKKTLNDMQCEQIKKACQDLLAIDVKMIEWTDKDSALDHLLHVGVVTYQQHAVRTLLNLDDLDEWVPTTLEVEKREMDQLVRYHPAFSPYPEPSGINAQTYYISHNPDGSVVKTE